MINLICNICLSQGFLNAVRNLISHAGHMNCVAPRIDFDNHKPFEETTNEFFMFENYFYNISGSPRDWI